MSLFAAVVGLAAFLLFEVQLVLGKQVLPWFGGASAVWTTCLLFFQAGLLVGYAWAHALGRLSPRRQRDAHLALLAAAVGLVAWRALVWPSPITPGEWARPASPEAPVRAILGLLGSTIGLPFVLLAASSPLLQAWFARRWPGRSPYWLFALSNAGSLLGLVGYPLVVEPLLSVRAQGWAWSAAFLAFAAGAAWCALATGSQGARPASDEGATVATTDPSEPVPSKSRPMNMASPRPSPRAGPPVLDPWKCLRRQVMAQDDPRFTRVGRLGLTWLALAFFPSVMLGAVTGHLTQEVAAVPFLWMLPLSLYLLTFILSFAWPDAGRAVSRVALAGAAGAAVLGVHGALSLHVHERVLLWSAVLFAYGMAGHGELARLRPGPARLTGYYLVVATGGALGGLLNAVVAPLLFEGYWELHLGILAGPLAVLWAAGRATADPSSPDAADDGAATRQPRVLAGVGVAVLAGALLWDVATADRGTVHASRSFYGVLRVVREEAGEPDESLRLLHGRITHGVQLVRPERRSEVTTYFGPTSGVGLAIRRHPKRLAGAPMRVGVIGLGAGTLAAWSRSGDSFRFYELDPDVARLSTGEAPLFTFLRDAGGAVDVVLGDGRLALERETPRAYDVLAIDAFSSDAVPTHLLTREAFAVYRRHLAPGGVLAVQVTNRYVDLKPVVRGAAAAVGLRAEHVPSHERGIAWSSDWMIVTGDRALLDDELVSAATLPRQPKEGEALWTDGWSHLLGVVKR
jgi:SAM-dependent methyltransferase